MDNGKSSWWTLTFHQVLSTCISLTGFVFVIIGIRTNTQTIERTIYFEMSKLSYETDMLFIQHPELRPYFYENKEIRPEDSLYSRAVSVSELLLDYFDTFLDMNYLNEEVKSNKGWINWVDGSFSSSPVLVSTLEESKQWYPNLYSYYEKWKLKK